MQVMVALRGEVLSSGPHIDKDDPPPGPPAFVQRANAQLLENLRAHVFAPHADQLRVRARAGGPAAALLIFGSWHPGMHPAERALTPEQVADAILHGVSRRGRTDAAPTPAHPPRAVQEVARWRSSRCSSSAPSRRSTCPASTPTSSTTASSPATRATSCVAASRCSPSRWCRSSARSPRSTSRARTAMSFGRDVRTAIFHRVGSFSNREVQHFGAPSLITRETNDVQQVQTFVLMAGTLLVAAPIMLVGGLVMAMREDLGLSWLVAVVVPVLIGSVALRRVADGAVLPPGPDPHRRGQPAAPRADHRRARRPRLRPRARTRPSASPSPTTTSPPSRPAPVAGWPRCSRP